MLELNTNFPASAVPAVQPWPESPLVIACRIHDPRLRDSASPLLGLGKLFALSHGAATLHTNAGHLLAPAARLAWLPAGVAFQMVLHGSAAGIVLCLARELCSTMPGESALFAPNRVASALVASISEQPAALETTADASRLGLLFSELYAGPTLPLRLPMPARPQAAKVARAILLHPEERRSEQEWAEWAGISRRSLIRHFEHCGLGFAEWRRRARAIAAIERLARGSSVAETAGEVGYASVSAFIHRFRSMLGSTPGDFLRA